MTMDFPRLVHVSSAGTTRPGRPDLAPEARTKIVAMNDALGGLLTAKLEGENAIRESGVPFAVVRSCALTEEPAGAPLEIEQGDNMAVRGSGRVSGAFLGLRRGASTRAGSALARSSASRSGSDPSDSSATRRAR